MSEEKKQMMWAIVNRNGYVCSIRYTRKQAIQDFMTFLESDFTWKKIQRKGFHRCIRVSVIAEVTP